MVRKRRKAPRILLHPMLQWIRGKMGKIVYRLTLHGDMAAKSKRSKGRPFDLALSDYFQGNNLFWQKLHDDQPKPDDWCW
jgi:hypothetical protein